MAKSSFWTTISESYLFFCSLHKAKVAFSPYAQTPRHLFVSRVSHAAQTVAQRHDLYPSVMLAQAILESNNGQSQLSQKPYYNFFGIKGNYKGHSVILPTLEDDGQGNLYQIDDAFRSYGNLSACFEDYARLLSDPLYQNTHKKKADTYQEVTTNLTGTYATDTAYAAKLNQVIETYQLYYFDYPIK